MGEASAVARDSKTEERDDSRRIGRRNLHDNERRLSALDAARPTLTGRIRGPTFSWITGGSQPFG